MSAASVHQVKRIAVIGAGPIGLEAALYATALGHDVVVYERGDVAQAVATWRHVTLFSPWRMNTSSLGRRALREAGIQMAIADPNSDRCPTGAELIESYLRPLTQTPALRGRVLPHQRVVAVGRPWLLKGEQIGKASRAEHGFRLLIQTERDVGAGPSERVESADVLLDCSGTFFCPNPIGQGGIAAVGERGLAARIWHHVPDILGRDRDRFVGRRVLIVGGGHSAATAAVLLGELMAQSPGAGTQAIWAHRDEAAAPYPLAASAADDPLPERRRLHLAANAVTEQPGLRFLPSTVVSGLQIHGDGAIGVRLTQRPAGDQGSAAGSADRALPDELVVDEILGLTGYGPDRSIYEQLQVHECYASLGPMKLAAALLGASGDCLAQPTPGPETLRNPEPGFFILGAKSYGRNSAFLLQIGHAQIRSVFQLLQGQPELDLYADAGDRA
ncbi:MAG: FAD-dependent oxidoreductase [Elusimicrobia bacterium]|nr:MAG: FAD-dependent oxidoreductase [Elusimicrobiota bacterium]